MSRIHSRRAQARHALAMLAALAVFSLPPVGRASRAWADSPAATSTSATITAEDLAKRRAQTAQRITALNDEKGKLPANSPPDVAAHIEEQIELLENLDLAYVQHLAALDERSEGEQDLVRLADQRDALRTRGPLEPKPYSYLLWDEIRDQLEAERAHAEAIQSDAAAASQMLQAARDGAERAQRDLRLSDDGVPRPEGAPPSRSAQLATLRAEVADATAALRRAEVSLQDIRLQRSKARCDFLQEKCDLIGKQYVFDQREYDSRLALIKKSEDELRGKLRITERMLQKHENDQAVTVARLRKESADRAVLDAAIDASQLVRRGRREELTLLNQRLGEFEHFRRLLALRFAFVNHKISAEDRSGCRGELRALVERDETLERSCAQRITEIQGEQSALLRRLREVDAASPIHPWLEMQQTELDSLEQLYQSTIVQTRVRERSFRRFLNDIGPGAAETARQRLADLGDGLLQAWNYPLEKVDDRPVTVRQLVLGLIYFIVGLFLARVGSKILGRMVLARFGLNEGARNAIQSIAYYVFCLACSLLALDLTNLPFAAFTFLGGAVAIGIGFGSQNILNNFISGLILLAEQPLRVGDCVNIEGDEGTVEHIGARSTRVRTMQNHEIMVPNSKLLENKVTNLTLTDNLVQTAIGVTVSPSLPVSEVRRRLLAAATRHPLVLTDPKPIVLLLSFGEKELSFELRFWFCLNSLQECRTTESDIREAISDLLSEANPATTAAAGIARPAASGAPKPNAATAVIRPPAGLPVPAPKPPSGPISRPAVAGGIAPAPAAPVSRVAATDRDQPRAPNRKAG